MNIICQCLSLIFPINAQIRLLITTWNCMTLDFVKSIKLQNCQNTKLLKQLNLKLHHWFTVIPWITSYCVNQRIKSIMRIRQSSDVITHLMEMPLTKIFLIWLRCLFFVVNQAYRFRYHINIKTRTNNTPFLKGVKNLISKRK